MPYAELNLEGRLVNEPEFRTGKDNQEYVTFRVAVNQQFGSEEYASFYSCTGKEDIANRVRKAGLHKGRLIHISGGLVLKDYQNKNGETRTSADVSIYNWHYVGAKPKTEGEQAPAPATQGRTGAVHNETYIGDPDDLPL